MNNVLWRPQKGAQVKFLQCPIYEVLLEGTRGGGKTDALLMSFIQGVGRGYGEAWRGILFRLTYPQLADVVAKSKKWFYPVFGDRAKFNSSDYFWEFDTGERLYFRYGEKEDDYWNYHGHEYPWVGFEELTNWRSKEFYLQMQTTCRSSVDGLPRMVRATSNPYGRGHGWVKERFRLGTGGAKACEVIKEDGKDRCFIHSDIRENAILLKHDPSYFATLEAIKDKNRRAAWLNGSWDIHVGSYLDGVWDASVHIVKSFMIPAGWKCWRAMDWGYSSPYSVMWFAMDNDGCVYVWRELYGKGAKDNEGSREDAATVAKKVIKAEQHDERNGIELKMNVADPSIFANALGQYGQNNSIAKIFKDNGVKWLPAWNAKGSRINGAQLIVQMLSENKLKFFDTCTHALRTIPTIPPDDNNLEDVDTEAEDHAWDCLRYGLTRHRAKPVIDKPAEEEEELIIRGDTHTFKARKQNES